MPGVAGVTNPPGPLVRAIGDIALGLPGIGKLVRAYRHVAFDLPRSITAVGVGVLLGIAAIRLDLLAMHDVPHYLGAYFALIGALATLAAAAMLAGPRPRLVRAGWWLGSLVALASLGMYLASRTFGLPDLPQLVGRWEYAPGTLAMALSATFLAVHGSVLTKLNVAYPQHQQWHD